MSQNYKPNQSIKDNKHNHTDFKSVIDALNYWSVTTPDNDLITYIDNNHTPYTLTYKEFRQRVESLSIFLKETHNLKNGDRIAVIGNSSLDVVLFYFAIIRQGCILVPIDPKVSSQQQKFIIESTQCSLIVSESSVSDILNKINIKFQKINCINNLKIYEKNIIDLPTEFDENQPAIILSTSGTTSEPKLPCLSHGNLMSNSKSLKVIHNANNRTISMCVLPIFHANAFCFSLVGTIYWGGKVVLTNGLLGLSTGSIANEYKVHIISLVPSLIRVLLTQRFSAENIPSLKYITSAAAPLPQKLAVEFFSKTRLRIHQGWGLTECTNFATKIPWHLTDKEYEEAMHDNDFCSIGCPTSDCSVEVIDVNTGENLNEGEVGELIVQGKNLMLGYWNRDDLTLEVLTKKGLKTGDLGYWRYIANSKMYFICGRLKEIIIRNGENISPIAVENELLNLSPKFEMAVIGFNNNYVGEEVGLYINVGRHKLDKAQILNMLDQVTEFQRPRCILLGKTAIPRTSTGKIQRKKLTYLFDNHKDKLLNSRNPMIIELE